MSVDTFVFINDARLPTVDQWRAALERASTAIVLDDFGELRTFRGRVPATFDGHATGFEWNYGPIADVFTGPVPDGRGDRDRVVDCVMRGSLREMVCGMLAMAVLAEIGDGLVYDERTSGLISPRAALEYARKLQAELT